MIFMAKRINAKLVMELLGKGMSAREIYKTRRISRESTKKVVEAMAATGLTWEQASNMDEADVYDRLFPQQAQEKAAVLDADYDYVHAELQRVGVTQKLLWEEYRDEAGAKGLAAISYTSFCRG
ncbi:MAG: IS21 family transposase, partial [Eggerthellales bacterium]|nr:IS21 family transposase [Eggerthellales bacterium]